MAIVHLSGNLNTWGNNGAFETDRSTWGFPDSGGTVTRTAEAAHAGNYSLKWQANDFLGFMASSFAIAQANYASSAGKKYIAYARIRNKGSQSVGHNDLVFSIFSLGANLVQTVTRTVGASSDDWLTLESRWEGPGAASVRIGWAPADVFTGKNLNTGGICYVDSFEIYEYTEEEAPPPACTINIEEGLVVVTDESAPGAGDGSIQGAASGAVEIYWSINGVDWQASSLFAGLGAGTYTLRARDQGNQSCIDTYVVSINSAPTGFDFTIAVTHETISGANDGSAVLTPSGTGAPYTYSKDGGASYQSGNSFPALPPGTYAFVVKDSSGNMVVKYATINAGAIDIEKVWHSRNPVILEKLAGPGWGAINNYRLYNDVRVEDVTGSGAFNSKLKVDLHPDESGKCVFYLSEAFRDVFTFTTPDVNATEIVKLTDRIKRFKNFSGSLQDAEVTPGVLTESLPSLVLWGGLSREKFPLVDYFASYLSTHKKFLTWAPLQKYVDRTQEDYLNFFVYGFSSTIKLRIKAYFDDSTDETTTVKTKTGVQHFDLYRIPAGPTNSGATTVNPAKNLIKYELSLLDQADAVISEVRTYHVIRVRNPLTRHFMFLNSLGGDEVLRFTGQAMHTTGFQREILQKFLPHNYDPLEGEFAVNEIIGQKRNSYSSGYIKGQLATQWHAYLEDFLLSPRVFLVTDGQRLPVVITGGELNIEDQNHERFIRFEAKPAYDNVSYTPSDVV